MERNVNAGQQHERFATTVLGSATLSVSTQSLQTGDGTSQHVLRTGEVVVHNLNELTGGFGNRLNVFGYTVVANAELVGAQRSHTVVCTTVLVTLDQAIHCRTAVEDENEHSFQRNNAGERTQGIVFTQRMTSEVRRPDVAAAFAQTCSLYKGNCGECNLSELSEVEQTVRMVVAFAVSHQFLRVITHNSNN